MEFKEDFLQLVWKYLYFERKELQTTEGQDLVILQTGFHNTLEGPDFQHASLEIGGILFHGHVEVHRKASEWKQHSHFANASYNSVILHVVWEDDQEVYRSDGTPMPTLELKGKIFLDIWRNYQKLLDFKSDVPCAHALPEVPEIVRFSALEKALVERMYRKSLGVHDMLAQTHGDWEEVAYRCLAISFGFGLNGAAMKDLSSLVPYSLLRRYRHQNTSIEAMLLGQAGLLPESTDDPYVAQLKRDHDFFQKKFKWQNGLSRSHWSFLGARPSNFPTLRIAQLASVLEHAPHLLSSILEDNREFDGFKRVFQAPLSPYWQKHYGFGKKAKKSHSTGLSEASVRILIINFVLPLWFAFGKYMDQEEWKERCFAVLQSLVPEDNYITRKFAQKGWLAGSAFDSQGMIELHNSYCQAQKCLSCRIGQNLLRQPSQ
ncbi:MAG: DUF2851 family protein [Algoriphagus sp.]